MAAPRLPIVPAWLCALLAGASSAVAEPPAPTEPPLETAHVRVTEILADIERREPEPGWFALELERMRISGKYGLIYARELGAVELRVRGPALGHSKQFGVSVELRF